MNNKNEYILGIDTSNYKTSVAIVDKEGNIISDIRKLLTVKQGERGLRQSGALFQHIENLPHLMEEAFDSIDPNDLKGVAVSSKPRPVQGSYMPVFKAGISLGRSIAAAAHVPYMEFSHQEGHIASVQRYSSLRYDDEILCYHLSGGTCELLKVKKTAPGDFNIEIIGGSKDISFGQVLDRVGVFLGMQFPAGGEMDKIVLKTHESTQLLKPIPIDNLHFNLSGIETQWVRTLESGAEKDFLLKELFDKFVLCLTNLTERACRQTKIEKVLFAGGVSSSEYIKNKLENHFDKSGIQLTFGTPGLSGDNAVGTALLGGEVLWQ